MIVFVSMAGKAYELTEVIGVFSDREDALQRCRDRPFADEEMTWQYDRHWVEEWEVDGLFVRQYNMDGLQEIEEAAEF